MSERDESIEQIYLLTKILEKGRIVGRYEGDGKERYWWSDGAFGAWLFPGDFVYNYRGEFYVVRAPRDVASYRATPPGDKHGE